VWQKQQEKPQATKAHSHKEHGISFSQAADLSAHGNSFVFKMQVQILF
jgi:hypothetical protein